MRLFAEAERREVRALVSVPPQFGKTETILHGCAWLLARHPEWSFGYSSYSSEIVRSKSRSARDYARLAGVQFRDDATSTSEWRTRHGGGMLARSIGGSLTSMGLNVLVVDDPHKDREDAESALSRQRIHDWFTSTARTRVHPGGSIIVCHTRWHSDDLIGRLSKELKPDGSPQWEVINLPAIDAGGNPLWHQRPKSFLDEARRASEYDWWSLYMGSPRPRGTSVFRGVSFYDELPKLRYRVGKGVDLAYTAKTRADWSTSVVMLEANDEYYVTDVRRAQVEAPDFIRELAMVDVVWPGPWHWFSSSTERGLADVVTDLGDLGVVIEAVLATADKFVRAQRFAAAWNDRRVHVPRNAPWLKAFVDELGAFSGVGDRKDDQVDGAVSAFERLQSIGPDRHYEQPRNDSRWSDEHGRGY